MSPNQIEGSQTPRAALWHGASSHTPLVNVCEPVVRGEGVAALQTDSPRTAFSHEEIDRSQAGRAGQLQPRLPGAAILSQRNVCEPVAVQDDLIPPIVASCTATFVASAFALRQALAACTSVAPRQRLSVVTPAHRSGKTWSASVILAATAGKFIDRTGEAA